jgi:hypothetical protein
MEKLRNDFSEWLNTLQVGIYPEIRQRVIAECKITAVVFRQWRCGASKIPPLAKEKINIIAEKQVFTTNNTPEL